MKETTRTLEEAIYELDSNYESAFCMLNGAKFISSRGIEFVGLDGVNDDEGKSCHWKVRIEQDQKIGQVMDRVPFGILNKAITGLGATRLEIMNQERNSIIVVPTKSLAYSKYKSVNSIKGEDYAFYVGSPIKEIKNKVSSAQIQRYLQNSSTAKKKFLVVADSLPFLIKILEDNKIEGYVLFNKQEPQIVIKENGMEQTILQFVMDEIKQNKRMIEDLTKKQIEDEIQQGNYNFNVQQIVHDILQKLNNQEVSLKDTSSSHLSYMQIEYYTLIAMACMYGGMLGLTAINNQLANMSAKGKRVSVSPNKKGILVLSSALGSYLVSLVGLAIL